MSILLRLAAAFAITATMAACSADQITSVSVDPNQSARVAVGQEIRITLGNVGPAEYESPPQMSSAALSFLGVADIPPYTPGGATQQFRFMATAAGTSVIHFRRMLGDSVVRTVDDTIIVR